MDPMHIEATTTAKFLDKPALHALIVGINAYPSLPRLNGAVADAEAMKMYLMDKLGVSDTRIKLLLDQQATRQAILDGLKAFQTDTAIKKDDPILIFFAGHGSTANAPEGWHSADSTIQLICPYDYDLLVGETKVSGLPDRTIAVLLDRIAAVKGNNITVIFDCCHSGSGTRSPKYRIRGLKGVVTIPKDLDRDIWGRSSRASTIPKGFLTKNLRSHVLLAACGARETAGEDYSSQRGIFTQALLEKLEQVGAERVTYAELIRKIPGLAGGRQNPQCEGEHSGRYLFDAKLPNRQHIMYAVKRIDNEYVIEAGAMHGIAAGAHFAVYKSHNRGPTDTPLGVLVATEPQIASTTMTLLPACQSFHIPTEAFALKQSPGEEEILRIYIEGEKLRESLRSHIEAMTPKIIIVHTKSIAHLGISVDSTDNYLFFDIFDERVTRHGLTRVPYYTRFDSHQLSFDPLERVLCSAAHYHWHLRRYKDVLSLQSRIQIEMKELEEDLNPDSAGFSMGPQPCGSNLVKKGIVDVVANPDNKYGLKITNKSTIPLYPYVFSFCTDFTIERYYQPGISGGKADIPLPPGGSVTIGYGAGGGNPIRYALDSKEIPRDGFIKVKMNLDVDLLKVFLSTKEIDLSDLPQSSPFIKSKRFLPRKSNRDKREFGPLWHAILIPVIQRRTPLFRGLSLGLRVTVLISIIMVLLAIFLVFISR